MPVQSPQVEDEEGSGSVHGNPASDPALALPRLAEALRGFFVLVSSPDALPEFNAIQVRAYIGQQRVCS